MLMKQRKGKGRASKPPPSAAADRGAAADDADDSDDADDAPPLPETAKPPTAPPKKRGKFDPLGDTAASRRYAKETLKHDDYRGSGLSHGNPTARHQRARKAAAASHAPREIVFDDDRDTIVERDARGQVSSEMHAARRYAICYVYETVSVALPRQHERGHAVRAEARRRLAGAVPRAGRARLRRPRERDQLPRLGELLAVRRRRHAALRDGHAGASLVDHVTLLDGRADIRAHHRGHRRAARRARDDYRGERLRRARRVPAHGPPRGVEGRRAPHAQRAQPPADRDLQGVPAPPRHRGRAHGTPRESPGARSAPAPVGSRLIVMFCLQK